MRKKQRGRGFKRPEMSEFTSAQCQHASPSTQGEHSPVLFTQHGQRPRANSALAGLTYSAAGQAALALHSMAVLHVFQAKMLTSEEAALDATSGT